MTRKCFCLAAVLGILAGGAAFFPARAEVTLAVIAPKSGEYARAGEELFNGAKMAVQEINDNGGLNGEKLDMLTIDDRCDDRLAVSTAEMLTLLKSKKIGLKRLPPFMKKERFFRLCRQQWLMMQAVRIKKGKYCCWGQRRR